MPKSVKTLASAKAWVPSKSVQIFSRRGGRSVETGGRAWFGCTGVTWGVAAGGVLPGLQLETKKNRLNSQAIPNAERALIRSFEAGYLPCPPTPTLLTEPKLLEEREFARDRRYHSIGSQSFPFSPHAE